MRFCLFCDSSSIPEFFIFFPSFRLSLKSLFLLVLKLIFELINVCFHLRFKLLNAFLPVNYLLQHIYLFIAFCINRHLIVPDVLLVLILSPTTFEKFLQRSLFKSLDCTYYSRFWFNRSLRSSIFLFFLPLFLFYVFDWYDFPLWLNRYNLLARFPLCLRLFLLRRLWSCSLGFFLLGLHLKSI